MLSLICKTLAVCTIAINSAILLVIAGIYCFAFAGSLLLGGVLGDLSVAVVALGVMVQSIIPITGLILGWSFLSNPRRYSLSIFGTLITLAFIYLYLNGSIEFVINQIDTLAG